MNKPCPICAKSPCTNIMHRLQQLMDDRAAQQLAAAYNRRVLMSTSRRISYLENK